MQRNYGGRRTARYPDNADLHGKLREARFDLPAEAPSYRLAPHEQAQAAFGQMAHQDQDALTGWVVASIRKVVPRAPYDGTAKIGLLGASTLAEQAAQDLNKPVTASEVAGAALALDFKSVTMGWGPADLKFAAEWKDS